MKYGYNEVFNMNVASEDAYFGKDDKPEHFKAMFSHLSPFHAGVLKSTYSIEFHDDHIVAEWDNLPDAVEDAMGLVRQYPCKETRNLQLGLVILMDTLDWAKGQGKELGQ